MAVKILKNRCCICNREIDGYGNNPYPIDKNENHRCCDLCNMQYVIPARLVKIYEGKKK